MAPKQGLCMSDTTDREGGVHICSYLMRACWCVFLWRTCVDMYAGFRNAWGPCWQYFSRKHMFSADRAGDRGD